MARSLLSVPGLASTSQEFMRDLWVMASRHSWDADAIATVISIESGFRAEVKNPQQGQTASGLIQFTDATAKGLGVAGGAEEVRRMSAVQQLPLVERYYIRAFAGRSPRPVDFYLAGWGSGIGQPEEFILARVTDPKPYNSGNDNLYTLNRGLDTSKDGVITVGDISAKIKAQQARAGGKRIEISEDIDIPKEGSSPLVASPGSLRSVPAPLLFGVPSNREGDLPTLNVGSKGSAVRLFFRVSCGFDTNDYDARHKPLVEDFQAKRGLKPDGIVGRNTWYQAMQSAAKTLPGSER